MRKAMCAHVLAAHHTHPMRIMQRTALDPRCGLEANDAFIVRVLVRVAPRELLAQACALTQGELVECRC